MQNQKLENQLNLALATPEREREKSRNLNVGYNPEERTWELIVKYLGDLSPLESQGITVFPLISQYAILTVPESLINSLSERPEILYVEKPKRLYFAINQAKAASCINPVQTGGSINLSGQGILTAVIDSGIDYFHADFRNEDGTTRILKLWDQTADKVYTSGEINEALNAGSRTAGLALVPATDLSGHGTAVAGIAAGNGRESQGRYRGIAYRSELLIVKLGVPEAEGFPRTTELMKAVSFVMEEAARLNRPVAVNLSFGNTYGSHDGTSLLETFLNDISDFGKAVICVGTGNEGASGGHTSGILTPGSPLDVEMSVAPYETGFSVQLWKFYVDQFDLSIVTPDGEVIGPITRRLGSQTIDYMGTRILLYYGEPSPYSRAQEIYLDFVPRDQYLDSGIWRFRLSPTKIVDGRYDFWLPAGGVLNRSTRFLLATPDTTLTIPSTAAMVISVGAYDDAYQSYADFSGRGFTRATNQVKPDIAAPGVNIVISKARGGYEAVTGTSFATPMVTGSAALLMEWGIVQGNDPFLYGEKAKAYLIRGARQLPGFTEWPNAQLGYGVLCLRDSLPL